MAAAAGASQVQLVVPDPDLERQAYQAACQAEDRVSSLSVSLGNDDPEQLDREIKAVVKDLVPGWDTIDDAELSITQITGGVTNLLFRVHRPVAEDDDSLASVLLRVYGANTDLLISREKETTLFRLIASMGAGPAYHGRFDGGRLEGYLEAKPLVEEQLCQPEIAADVAKTIAKFHMMDMPHVAETAGKPTPQFWHGMERWIQVVEEMDLKTAPAERRAAVESILAITSITALRRELEYLKRRLPSPFNGYGTELPLEGAAKWASEVAGDVVWSHNDILGGNCLQLEKDGSLQLIDFEYGAYNHAGIDLGNHWCEWAGFDFDIASKYPKDDAKKLFVRSYAEGRGLDLERAPGGAEAAVAALAGAGDAYALVSHLWWGVWAIVQTRHSPIDFDFADYARLRLRGYDFHKKQFFGGEEGSLVGLFGAVEGDAEALCAAEA